MGRGSINFNSDLARTFGRAWAGLAIVLFLAMPALAGLDSNQQKLLGDAQAHLKKMQANLKLAQDAAGPGQGIPSPSKVKLAMSRLESAKLEEPQVSERLTKLPSDDADVTATQTQLDNTNEEIATLEQRLTGTLEDKGDEEKPKDEPKGDAPKDDAPKGGNAKLDYRAAEALKNAQSYVEEVESHADALDKMVEEFNKAPDKDAIDLREVKSGLDAVANARQRAQYAENHLKKVPEDGAGYAETAAALKKASARVDAAEKSLTPIHERLTKLVDPNGHPKLADDTKRLEELAKMYANSGVFNGDREKAAALYHELPAAKEEAARIVKTYASLIQQETGEGLRLRQISDRFKYVIDEFSKTADAQKEALPGQIDGEIAAIGKMADEAVKEERPLYFTRGIPDQVGFLDQKVALCVALNPESGKEIEKKMDAMRADLRERQGKLSESIIAANKLPPNLYAGDDRKELEKLAADAWLKIAPDAKILAYCIPSAEWTRDSMWRYQNREWYKIDRSKLQVQLIIQHDDKVAEVRAIDLWKDHLQNDAIVASPLDEAKSEVLPQNLLPVGKVK